MEKIYVDSFVFLQKAPITASSENMPDFRCFAHGRIFFFSNKTLEALLLKKKIYITESYIIKFLVNIWNHGFEWSTPLQIWWTGVTFGHLS